MTERLLLPGPHPRARLQGTPHQTPPHPPLQATHERKGRALHPHSARRLGLRRHLRQLPGTPPRPSRLARLLQSSPTTQLPRPPTTATAAGGTQEEQPSWVLQLAQTAAGPTHESPEGRDHEKGGQAQHTPAEGASRRAACSHEATIGPCVLRLAMRSGVLHFGAIRALR